MGVFADLNRQLGITETPTGGFQPIRRPIVIGRRPGTISRLLSYLDRPREAVSEAVQAGYMGEGPLEAAWMGLQGEGRYGTIGEAMFPEARKPGFQPAADVPRFIVDAGTDPLIYAGPAIAKGAAKGLLWAGKQLVPGIKQVLPAVEKGLTWGDKVADLKSAMKTLDLGPLQAAKRVSAQYPGLSTKGVQRALELLKSKDFPLKRIEEIMPTPRELSAAAQDLPWGSVAPDDYLDLLRGSFRSMDLNFVPDVQTSLHSLTQDFARRLFPPLKALEIVGGKAGRQWGQGYKRALLRTRFRQPAWMKEFNKELAKASDADIIGAKHLREGLYVVRSGKFEPAPEWADIGYSLVPKGLNVANAERLAPKLGKFIDDFYDELVLPRNRDMFGRELSVYNPYTQTEVPLSQARIPGYFPHRLTPDQFTSKGRQTLRKKLIEDGMPERVVDNYIETRLSHAPKKVGHLEYARVSRTLNYEHNPKKVLPKYMYDSIFRQELAKEFGAKSEVLDNLVGDLKQLGVNTRWVDSLAQLTVGKNPHREAVEQLFKHLNTFQAISKLGYATTVANSLQAPHNIWVRSGFTNLAKSVLDKWSPVKPQHAMLGPAAYSRGLQEEILRAAIGDRSWLGDRYMRWVGFNWSEKMGRHLGAYSGYRELDEMAKTWVKLAPVNKKGADRLLGEIIRKYRIVDDPKDLRGAAELLRSTRGQLPQEILEMGALRASEATMHAFDLMELPTEWRDPFWRMVLQFKSFIYKQTEFMASEVMSPGLNWLASNGARGDIWPMVRTIAAVPAISQATTHLRDLAKSIPSHLWYTPQDLVEGKSPEEMWRAAARRWNYKDPFWEDPDPFGRMMTDAIYIGTLGLVGDMFEAASRGNLADWLLGPTIGEATDVWEAATRERRMGTVMTRWLPGALGIPSNVDIIKAVQRRLQ